MEMVLTLGQPTVPRQHPQVHSGGGPSPGGSGPLPAPSLRSKAVPKGDNELCWTWGSGDASTWYHRPWPMAPLIHATEGRRQCGLLPF